jgi:hypothetical protein
MENKAQRRRRDLQRIKNRTIFRMKNFWDYNSITASEVGRSAANHDTHQCKMCKWEKQNHIPKPSDLRAKRLDDYV